MAQKRERPWAGRSAGACWAGGDVPHRAARDLAPIAVFSARTRFVADRCDRWRWREFHAGSRRRGLLVIDATSPYRIEK